MANRPQATAPILDSTGHKSVTMTERAYAFLRIDDLHAVIGKPRFLGGDGEEGGA